MSDWKIQGQTGKSLGSAQVDLEVCNYTDVALTTTNQGTDSLSFFVQCTDPTIDPDYLPEYQQQVSLFRAGVRQFVGYVNKPKFILQAGIFGWQIEAQNGWAELDRVSLTDADKEYTRAQGSLQATVQDIINKAIAGGARISLGSVAAMFDIPAISFRSTSCGAALIEMLKICADAVAYFDYSGAGNPALTIERRGSMTAKTITFGTDEIVEPFSCSPVPGATPTKVTVAYATRDSNGLVTEYIQSAGSGADTQSVVLTGSNLADFQTKATANGETVRTTTSAAWATVYALDPKIKDIAGIPTPAGTSSLTYVGGFPSDKENFTITGENTGFYDLTSGATQVLIQGEWKEWMAKLGITKGSGKYIRDFYWTWLEEFETTDYERPEWANSLIAAGAQVLPIRAFNNLVESGTQADDEVEIIRYRAEFSVTTISRTIATATLLRDPGDYGTVTPPASLAANLLAAQAFVPYEGSFGLSPWHTPERLLSKKISFGGLTSRLSTIGALVQSETVDVETGAKTVQLGLPLRAGNTALARLRKLKE